jgi:recombinational DNA repair protein RecT
MLTTFSVWKQVFAILKKGCYKRIPKRTHLQFEKQVFHNPVGTFEKPPSKMAPKTVFSGLLLKYKNPFEKQ